MDPHVLRRARPHVADDDERPVDLQRDYQDTTYDARGNVSSQTPPYYASASSVANTSAYDALNRLVKSVHPDGASMTIGYGPFNTTRVVDEVGRVTSEQLDAYGHIVSRTEGVTSPSTTAYQYDVRGNLVGVTDAAGNHWSYVFDSLGRKATMIDPDSNT